VVIFSEIIGIMKIFILLSVVGLSVAQFPNGRILEPPNPQLCASRVIHERAPDGKGYFFSWRDSALQGNGTFFWLNNSILTFDYPSGVEEDWLGARNYCRQRCMDSVSTETSPENEWIKQRIVDGKVSVIKLSN
jgi:hypothetical protein